MLARGTKVSLKELYEIERTKSPHQVQLTES